jgi:hypothetical protein
MPTDQKKSFTAPDSMFLDAAEGWLGLGDWKSAAEELDRIKPGLRTEPRVLKLQWEICVLSKQWENGVEVGRLLVEAEPEESFGWVNRSYALRRAPNGGLQAAYDALKPAADHLEDLEQVHFNLACYACQLGNLDEARQWWIKCASGAAREGREQRIRKAALAETDLQPLWQEIRGPSAL